MTQRKIIDYTFSWDRDAADLALEINTLIKDGYIPLGGISMVYEKEKDEYIFAQALVKYEEE